MHKNEGLACQGDRKGIEKTRFALKTSANNLSLDGQG